MGLTEQEIIRLAAEQAASDNGNPRGAEKKGEERKEGLATEKY